MKRRSLGLRAVLVLSVAAGAVSAAQLAVLPQAGLARADASTGTAGLFVPTQGSVLDTRTGVGGVSGPVAANTWHPVQVAGRAGVPSTGVSAVQVSITVLTPATTGLVKAAANGTAVVPIAALTYTGGGGSISASSITALPADGKIQVLAQTPVTLLVHVQGYYTAGNGSPAPGGYVPVQPVRMVDTRTGAGLPQAKLATGSTTAISVGGLNDVPADASAVFVMLTAISTSTTAGYFSPYPTGTTRPPNVSLNYLADSATVLGAAVDLGAGGQFNLWIGPAGTAIDAIVDVVGYYTATPGTGGAFTPAAARVYDSRISPNTTVAAHSSRVVQVGGMAGVPQPTDGITAYALSAQVVHSGSGGGSLALGPGDQSSPAVSSVYFSAGSNVRSSLVIVPTADDGTVLLVNASPDPTHVILDVEGWFYSAAPARPTVTSSSFLDGQSNASPDPNAAFTFSARATVGNTATVAFRYTLDQDEPITVAGPLATVGLPVTTDGPHVLLVSALDANGAESDFADFAFEVGDSAPATEVTSDNAVETTIDTSVTATEADGSSSTETTRTVSAVPQQVPSGSGSIPRLSCRVGNHREIYPRATMDIRFQCASRVVNFGVRLAPPPAGATRVSWVVDTGFDWYRNGIRQGRTAWHDQPINYIFHGTFNPVYYQAHIYGTDYFHYSYFLGSTVYMTSVRVRVEFIAVS